MAYELSMWTAYPLAVREGDGHSVPALVLVAPNLSDEVDAQMMRSDTTFLESVLGRAVRHAAAPMIDVDWSEDEPLTMEDVLALTAENAVFRSALHDKGVVLAVPGERIHGCRIGLPATVNAENLDFWPR